jgi:hypothetical protein
MYEYVGGIPFSTHPLTHTNKWATLTGACFTQSNNWSFSFWPNPKHLYFIALVQAFKVPIYKAPFCNIVGYTTVPGGKFCFFAWIKVCFKKPQSFFLYDLYEK